MSALSEMLDVGRASLYRALAKLEGDSLILRDGKTITVLDRDAMLSKY
jgi:DNA-binding FadR family transcriptional regulator